MAKKLIFLYQDKEFQAEPIKIERKKIYGYSLIKYFDSNNSECEFATLTEDGLSVIPKGAIAYNILDENGNLISRDDLMAYDLEGNLLSKIPSSFDQKILLSQTATIEEYLSLNVSSIYQLQIDDPELLELLKQQIFRIAFNYRESYEPNDAFLLSNEKEVFMVVGSMANFEYLGLDNIVPELADNGEIIEDFEIDMDF